MSSPARTLFQCAVIIGSGVALLYYVPQSPSSLSNNKSGKLSEEEKKNTEQFFAVMKAAMQNPPSDSKEDKMSEGEVDKVKSVNVPEGILKRQRERNEKLTKRREADVDSQADHAFLVHFNHQFKHKQSQIESELDDCYRLSGDREALSDRLSRVSADINQLHRHLASSSTLLTPYDLRILKEQAAALEQRYSHAVASLLPKNKFTFKNRRRPHTDNTDSAPAPPNGVPPDQPDKQPESKVVHNIPTGPGFYDRSDATLVMREDETRGRDINLSNLVGCTVVITGCPSSVFVKSVSNSKIIVGPVATSVLIYGATRCTFVAWCHQMRLHDATDTDLYIKVSTNPIIENCRRVRFAPYNYTYPSIDKDIEASGLDPNADNWDKVADFDWLVVSHPSPYWTVIPPQLRTIHWPD